METSTWWAAADKNGRQFAHPARPKRNENSGWWTNEKEFYHFLGMDFVHGLTWENEPVDIDVSFSAGRVDRDHLIWQIAEKNFEGGKQEVIDNPEKYGLQRKEE